MKKVFVAASFLFLIPFVTGMGVGSGGHNYKIPVPDKNFTATITDSQDVSTEVSQISFNGNTFLAGSRGSSTVSVPFEKIGSLQVGRQEKDKKVSVAITIKGGGTVDMMVEGKLLCYGSTEFGNFQIELKDIKKVDIKGFVPPKEKP